MGRKKNVGQIIFFGYNNNLGQKQNSRKKNLGPEKMFGSENILEFKNER